MQKFDPSRFNERETLTLGNTTRAQMVKKTEWIKEREGGGQRRGKKVRPKKKVFRTLCTNVAVRSLSI